MHPRDIETQRNQVRVGVVAEVPQFATIVFNFPVMIVICETQAFFAAEFTDAIQTFGLDAEFIFRSIYFCLAAEWQKLRARFCCERDDALQIGKRVIYRLRIVDFAADVNARDLQTVACNPRTEFLRLTKVKMLRANLDPIIADGRDFRKYARKIVAILFRTPGARLNTDFHFCIFHNDQPPTTDHRPQISTGGRWSAVSGQRSVIFRQTRSSRCLARSSVARRRR